MYGREKHFHCGSGLRYSGHRGVFYPCGSVYFTLVLAILGIVFGVKGRKAEGNDKRGMATAGMVLGIVGVAATGLVVLCAICAVGTLAAAGSIS